MYNNKFQNLLKVTSVPQNSCSKMFHKTLDKICIFSKAMSQKVAALLKMTSVSTELFLKLFWKHSKQPFFKTSFDQYF